MRNLTIVKALKIELKLISQKTQTCHIKRIIRPTLKSNEIEILVFESVHDRLPVTLPEVEERCRFGDYSFCLNAFLLSLSVPCTQRVGRKLVNDIWWTNIEYSITLSCYLGKDFDDLSYIKNKLISVFAFPRCFNALFYFCSEGWETRIRTAFVFDAWKYFSSLLKLECSTEQTSNTIYLRIFQIKFKTERNENT